MVYVYTAADGLPLDDELASATLAVVVSILGCAVTVLLDLLLLLLRFCLRLPLNLHLGGFSDIQRGEWSSLQYFLAKHMPN